MLINCCSLGSIEGPKLDQHVSESRACKVLSIFLIVIGLLATLLGVASVIAVVAFGFDLGILTSFLVSGVSSGLGLLLLIVGLNCLVCRSLIAKAKASRHVLIDQEVFVLRQAVAESRAATIAAEKNVAQEIENFLASQKHYECIAGQKKQAEAEVLKTKEALLTAQKALENSESSQEISEGRGGIPETNSKFFSPRDKKTKAQQEFENKLQSYIAATDAWKLFIEQGTKSLQVDLLQYAFQKLSCSVQLYLEKSSALCNFLERKVVQDQERIEEMTAQIERLEQKLKDLTVTSSSQEETIKILQQQLEDLRKARVKLEEAQAQKLADMQRERESTMAQLNATISKLQQDKVSRELQKQLTQATQKLQEEKNKVERLEEMLREESKKLHVSEEETEKLREELRLSVLELTNLKQKILDLQIMEIQNKNLLSELTLEKTIKGSEQQRGDSLAKQLDDLRNQKDSELSLQAQKTLELKSQHDSLVVENTKFKTTLMLYERMLRHFEEKLEKKKHKDLQAFKSFKDSITSTQIYSREQILELSNKDLFDRMEAQRQENESLNQKLQEGSDKSQALQIRIQRLEAQIHNLTTTVQSQQEELIAKSSKITELQDKLLEETKKSSSSGALVQAMTMNLPEERRQHLLGITYSDKQDENSDS